MHVGTSVERMRSIFFSFRMILASFFWEIESWISFFLSPVLDIPGAMKRMEFSVMEGSRTVTG